MSHRRTNIIYLCLLPRNLLRPAFFLLPPSLDWSAASIPAAGNAYQRGDILRGDDRWGAGSSAGFSVFVRTLFSVAVGAAA
jgi:hypothetical protein